MEFRRDSILWTSEDVGGTCGEAAESYYRKYLDNSILRIMEWRD